MECSEVDVCKKLLGYNLVICVYFLCFNAIFDFFFLSGSHLYRVDLPALVTAGVSITA